MTRLISLFFVLAMAVQIIRPLGLPGLHRRVDAWKLAVIAVAIVSAVSVLKL